MVKGIGVLALLLFAGGYFLGAFGPQAYSRTVERPPAEVMRALETLDVTAQPGAPGSTPAAAGGIKPLFRLAKADNRMTWYVMSGDRVATTMTAELTPAEGGKATRIRTSVARGDAPDDVVSPAFRSKGLTMALFGAAIEGKINVLTAPPAATQEACQRLFDQMTGDHLPAGAASRPGNLTQAMGDGARTIVRLTAMEAELRRNGCNTNADGSFRTADERGIPHETMTPTDPGAPGSDLNHPRLAGTYASDRRTGTTTADRPMLDPTPVR